MSIWSRCYGSYVVPKTSGFSLKKFVESIYDEIVWNELTQQDSGKGNLIMVKFDFRFSLDGVPAAELIEKVVQEILSVPEYLYSQIDSEIRFT